MHTRKRVIIGEDHTILREGLSALISALPDYQVVDEAKDGIETIEAVDELSPDLVLIDISMPKLNGIKAIREIKARHPQTKIVVLTVHDEEEYVLAAYRAGAEGYVLKNAPKDELTEALSEVSKGRRFLSAALHNKLSTHSNTIDVGKDSLSLNRLTPREHQILRLIAEGHTNKEMAKVLSISFKTVGSHRTNLMKKLGLHNASEVTAYARKRGIIEGV